ncbi:MAG: electron transporter SenC, partial [Verrucomicrobia bacterium RIFCSPLOWO2_12_FULL_64_8]
VLAAVMLTVFALAGCGKKKEAAPSAGREESRHPLTGEIVQVNAGRKTLTVMHDKIKGFMPAMTMEFGVADGDLAIAKPGRRIRAELVHTPGGAFRLEKIWPADAADEGRVDAAARVLRQDTATRGHKAYREIGENLPDFALYDQGGRVVSAGRFRGKQIMLNFIFTRCPVATMCPAATLRMMEVQKAAREAGMKDLELISITLDPEYDTPGVLKDYARLRGIDTANFSFLTGPEAAIRDLLEQFGVVAGFEGGVLRHSLATLLIDAQGRIVHREDGSTWLVDTFVEKMRKG